MQGDYALVKSKYNDDFCNVATNGLPHRNGHDGAGFKGKIMQTTEVIFCCHQENSGGTPQYVQGSGPVFEFYKNVEAPDNPYYGKCYKAMLDAGHYTICCNGHWADGIFMKQAP